MASLGPGRRLVGRGPARHGPLYEAVVALGGTLVAGKLPLPATPNAPPPDERGIGYLQAVNEALHEAMAADAAPRWVSAGRSDPS